MKILILSHMYPQPTRGHYGLFVHEPAQELIKLGHTVEVIAPLPHTPPLVSGSHSAWRALAAVPAERELGGIRVRHPRYLHLPRHIGFAGSGRRLARAVFKLSDFDAYRDFDIIHAHAALPDGAAARLIAAELGLPYVVTSHGSDVVRATGWSLAVHGEVHDAFRHAGAVLAPSNAHLLRMRERGLPCEAAHVHWNGFATSPFLAETPPEPVEGPLRIIAVANLVPSKQIPLLVEAVHHLQERGCACHLHLIGQGPDEAMILSRTADLNIPFKHTRSLNRDDLARAFRSADVFALPARGESFGIVYLEAMASGLPVLAPCREGIADLIENGREGFLTDPDSPEAMTDALEQLAQDPQLRRAQGRNGILRAGRLGWDNHATGLVEIFNRVCSEFINGRSGTMGKVLHLLYNSEPDNNGYAMRSHYIMSTQRELGWDPQAATSPFQISRWSNGPRETRDGLLYHRLRFRGADTRRGRLGWRRYHVFLSKFLADRLLVAQVSRIIREERPELLHAHSPAFNLFLARRAARKAGRQLPIVYEVRGLTEETQIQIGNTSSGSPLYRLKRRIEERAMRLADTIVTISHGMRLDFGERGIDSDRIHLMPNGVDSVAITPPERDDGRALELGLTAGKVLGYIGSIGRLEGLPWLVEQLASLPADWRLLMIGDGQDRSAVLQLAADLGVGDRVTSPGSIPHAEVSDWYGLIDYLVLPRPSLRVTELVTPLKPLEGMAAGKIVFCSDIGGHREIIENGVNGFLFSRDNPAPLLERLQALAESPSERQHIGAAARAWVQSERDWHHLAKGYEEIYAAARKAAAKQ
ncbi:MAG: glycosyltransferase [bacterium]|nr:glycosyltransferase [bacterium]